jgi:spermidine synthase
LLALGAATAVLQTLAVREGMAMTSGDEAVVAILFGVWLFETALGASSSRWTKASAKTVTLGLAMYAPAMVGTVLASRASAGLLPAGQVPGLLTVGLAAAVLLAPACVLSGWVYGQLARPWAPDRADADEGVASARAYWLDTLGAAVTGALLAFFALDHLLPFQIAALACAAVVFGASARASNRRVWWLTAGLVPCVALLVSPLDLVTYRWHAPGQDVLEVRSSSHGALLVTERLGQQQVLLQREPILVPSDREDAEQIAHLSAALHPNPSRTLLMGVPPGNLIENLLAHGVTRLTIVAGDHHTAALVLDLSPSASDARVVVLGDDPRAWARSAPQAAFDLVLVHASSPASVAEARLFSTSFYRDLARLTAPDGLLVVTLPGFAAYASEAERNLHGTVATTLRTAFPNVLPLPADRTLYVAAASTLSQPSEVAATIASRLAQRRISPAFVTDAWLLDRLSSERVEQSLRWSGRALGPSTDTHPIVYAAALRSTLERLGGTSIDSLAVLAVTLLLLAAAWMNPRSRPVSFAVATTGFAGLALQLSLMLVYQTAVGALYRDVALVTALYMGASCAGTVLAMPRAATVRAVLAADVAQLAVAVMVAGSVATMAQWGPGAARVGVGLGAILIGGAAGAQFALASRVPGVFRVGVGASVYGIDLVGAALAALITITFLVPWIGIAGTAWVVAGLKATSSLALLWRPRAQDETRSWQVPLPMLLLVGLVIGTLVSSTEALLSRLTTSLSYQVAAVLVLAGGLALSFEPATWRDWVAQVERRCTPFRHRFGVSPLRAVTLLLLLPVAAMPLGRCYFTIPYVLCHACPRPCVFGLLRPYVITSALIANLGDLRFCQRSCPLGLAQTAAGDTAFARPRKLGRVAWLVRLVLLLFVAWLYFAVEEGPVRDAEGMIEWLYLNRYAASSWILAATGLVIVLSFFVRRPFCEVACPIGATSDALLRAEQLVRRSRKPKER